MHLYFSLFYSFADQDIANLLSLADTGQEQVQTGPGQSVPGHHYPRTGYRTRKEYHTLTVQERRRFHNALNKLYKVRNSMSNSYYANQIYVS